MAEELVNKGVALLNNGGSSGISASPIVVVGVARGGTSMVAGVLHHLGVFLGDRSHPPVFEDVRLAEAVERNDWQAAADIAQDYQLRGQRWGWKRPSFVNHLDKADEIFNKPIFVFVFKDLLSIAQRNSISMLSETLKAMDSAHRQYGQVLTYLEYCRAPAMLVSYEKALAYPEHFIEQLVEFSGLECSAAQRLSALNFIEPAPAKYLDVSRITKSQGRLGGVRDGKVYGWARFVHTPQAATVQFYLDDDLIGESEASKKRPDLNEKMGLDCGFEFLIPDSLSVKPTSVLRARVKGDVRDLNNSPLRLL